MGSTKHAESSPASSRVYQRRRIRQEPEATESTANFYPNVCSTRPGNAPPLGQRNSPRGPSSARSTRPRCRPSSRRRYRSLRTTTAPRLSFSSSRSPQPAAPGLTQLGAAFVVQHVCTGHFVGFRSRSARSTSFWICSTPGMWWRPVARRSTTKRRDRGAGRSGSSLPTPALRRGGSPPRCDADRTLRARCCACAQCGSSAVACGARGLTPFPVSGHALSSVHVYRQTHRSTSRLLEDVERIGTARCSEIESVAKRGGGGSASAATLTPASPQARPGSAGATHLHGRPPRHDATAGLTIALAAARGPESRRAVRRGTSSPTPPVGPYSGGDPRSSRSSAGRSSRWPGRRADVGRRRRAHPTRRRFVRAVHDRAAEGRCR